MLEWGRRGGKHKKNFHIVCPQSVLKVPVHNPRSNSKRGSHPKIGVIHGQGSPKTVQVVL